MKNLILIFLPVLVSCATTYVPPDRNTDTAGTADTQRENTQDLAVTPSPTPEPVSVFDKFMAETPDVSDSMVAELNVLRETISELEHEVEIARGHALQDMYRVFWDVIAECPPVGKCDIPDYTILWLRADMIKTNRDRVTTYEK